MKLLTSLQTLTKVYTTFTHVYTNVTQVYKNLTKLYNTSKTLPDKLNNFFFYKLYKN